MKTLSIFLALLISSFSLQTCLDEYGCALEQAEATACHDSASQEESADFHCQDSGESDHEDDCAPGCHCLCCGMIFLSSHTPAASKTGQAIASFQGYVSNLRFSDFHNSIWQPPRLLLV